MRAVGMATRVSDKTATVSVVLLDGEAEPFVLDEVALVEKFDVKVDEAPLADQLGELANRVDGYLRSMAPDCVVVRRADVSSQPSKKEGPRFRLLLEGSITAVAKRLVPDTHLRNGRTCAASYPAQVNKEELDNIAESLVGVKKYGEAAAAALSGFGER